MDRESPYSAYKFQRELTYAFLQNALWVQWSILGSPKGILIDIQKGLWKKSADWLRSKFFGKLNKTPEFEGVKIEVDSSSMPENEKFKYRKTSVEFPEGVINREQLDEADQEIFDYLNEDWNEIYEEYREKSSFLGHLASYMVGKGENEEIVKDWSVEDLHNNLTEKHNLPGLDEVEDLMDKTGFSREQVYQLIYAKSKGAEWLAIYDKNGNRQGKAYESITQMYRNQIAEALVRGASVADIRSLMIFPDDDILHKYGEDVYQNWIEEHLNRNWHRFAVTESAINFENGKLLQGLVETKQGTPVYYQYVRQVASKKAKHKPVTCDRCLEWAGKGLIARLFPSQSAFEESEFYGGEDTLINDPFAEIAIWVGKSNAERGGMGSWWACTPAHPFCGCHWVRYNPGKTEQFSGLDEIDDIFNQGAKRNIRHQRLVDKKYEEERAKYKSILINGVWHEKTCACNHEFYAEKQDSWLHNYIDSMLIN